MLTFQIEFVLVRRLYRLISSFLQTSNHMYNKCLVEESLILALKSLRVEMREKRKRGIGDVGLGRLAK